MTELVEYTLVVMVSTLFVAGSAFVYNSFTGFEASLQLKAAFDAVSGTAIQAVEGGTGSATLTLPDSTIRCEGESLTVGVGSANITRDLPVACSFDVRVPAGVHTVTFVDVGGELDLSVN